MTRSPQKAVCQGQRIIFWLLILGLLVHVVVVVILGSVPPISRDALNHHLAVPKMYLLHGGMHEIPSMHFSYFPMNVDLLYMLPLYFKFDIAAKYLHFLFALLTAWLLYRYLKKIISPAYGLLGALFFLTIPVIVKLSVIAYVDLGLIFFSWLCLYSFLKWCDTEYKPRYLIVAGVACGLALGTKYNALILLLIMAAMIPLTYSRNQNKRFSQHNLKERNRHSLKGVYWGGIFILIALIIFSPWMIRNTIWKHNPVYPLFNNVFNPHQETFSHDSAALKQQELANNPFWQRKNVYNETFLQTLLIPVRAFFQGQDDNPKYFDGKLNPCLLLLPLLAFVCTKETFSPTIKHHRNILTVFSILFVLFVLFESDFRIRYMAPAIPPLVILAVLGAHNTVQLLQQQAGLINKIGLSVLILSISYAFVYNGFYIFHQFDYIRPFDYLFGKASRDAYVARYRTEHPVIAHANAILPQDARVLCLSIGDRTYYLDRKAHLAEDFFDRNGGEEREKQLISKMVRYGTTHIIFNRSVYTDWATQLKKTERRAFENVFTDHTKLLYEENGVQLLEVLHNR
jgi:hypothetical protein